MRRRRDRPGRLIVLGGGLSGSLLVQELAAGGLGPIELIDRLPLPTRGRSWATFTTTPTAASSRTYAYVVLKTPGGLQRLDLRDHLYEVVDSGILAQRTDAALVELHGCRTQRDVPDGGDIDADGAWVFDSRGEPSSPAAWMHFHGWRVEAAADCFDPTAVTLMDLTVPQRGSLRFGYVLPASERAALIELTVVTRAAGPLDLGSDLESYVQHLAPCGWRIAGQERGSIALAPQLRRRRRGRTLPIGTPAGMVRASTGYGLPAMRLDAQVIAAELAHRRRPRGWKRPARHVLMDAVFLDVALEHPDIAVRSFERLFARNPVDRVVRFLTDESTLADDARLIAALPVLPFVAAAARRTVRPLQRR